MKPELEKYVIAIKELKVTKPRPTVKECLHMIGSTMNFQDEILVLDLPYIIREAGGVRVGDTAIDGTRKSMTTNAIRRTTDIRCKKVRIQAQGMDVFREIGIGKETVIRRYQEGDATPLYYGDEINPKATPRKRPVRKIEGVAL